LNLILAGLRLDFAGRKVRNFFPHSPLLSMQDLLQLQASLGIGETGTGTTP